MITETVEAAQRYWGGPWGRSIITPPSFLGDGAEIEVFSNDNIAGPPRSRCVQLSRQPVIPVVMGNVGPTANVFPRARISWGVGGLSNQCYVDWSEGSQFNLLCTTIRIDLVGQMGEAIPPLDNGDGAPSPVPVPEPLALQWGAALGIAGADQAPLYTSQFFAGMSASAGKRVFQLPVPQFATRVFPFASKVGVAGELVFALNDVLPYPGGIGPGFPQMRWEYNASSKPMLSSQGIPLTNYVKNCTWINLEDIGDDITVGCVFQLGL